MRPQRNARGRVSYAEELSDDDFTAPTSRSIRKTIPKKNAVEPEKSSPAQKNQRKERPNPRERAEAMQLERAIKESLSDAPRQPSERLPSVAFQCLLDVTSREQCDSEAAPQEESNVEPKIFPQIDLQEAREHAEEPTCRVNQETCIINLSPEASSIPELDVKPTGELQNKLTFSRTRKRDEELQEETTENLKPDGAEELDSKHQESKNEIGDVAPKPEKVQKCFTRLKQVREASTESSDLLLPRRVVGLSKRFRPPPLHRYLTN